MTDGVSSVVTESLGMVPTESALAGVLQLEASSSSGGEEGETSAVWVAKQESALIARLTSYEAPVLKGTGGQAVQGGYWRVAGQQYAGNLRMEAACLEGDTSSCIPVKFVGGHLKHRCPSMLGPGRSRSHASGTRQGELGHWGVYCISILNEKLVVSCVLITA